MCSSLLFYLLIMQNFLEKSWKSVSIEWNIRWIGYNIWVELDLLIENDEFIQSRLMFVKEKEIGWKNCCLLGKNNVEKEMH